MTQPTPEKREGRTPGTEGGKGEQGRVLDTEGREEEQERVLGTEEGKEGSVLKEEEGDTEGEIQKEGKKSRNGS